MGSSPAMTGRDALADQKYRNYGSCDTALYFEAGKLL
jgi:hypothetical protein